MIHSKRYSKMCHFHKILKANILKGAMRLWEIGAKKITTIRTTTTTTTTTSTLCREVDTLLLRRPNY
jgi:hypothetical protein